MSKKYFKETVEVKGKVYWIGAIVLVFLLSLLGFIDKMKETDGLLSLSGASIAIVAVASIIFVITKIELKTKVTSKSIDVKLSPFYRSKVKIPHSDVASYRIVETEPFTLRTTKNFNSWFEKRFTLTGRNGVSITTCNGINYFIGTTDPEALKKAMQKVHGSD